MLPLKYEAVKPLLLRDMRLTALNSKARFGSNEIDDEHLLNKLDSYIDEFNTGDSNQMGKQVRALPPVDMDRERLYKVPHPDTLWYGRDSRRNYRSIEERFRKGFVNIGSIRRIIDPPTRIHVASSRGAERMLVDLFNDLDGEFLNYKSLVV